MTIDEVRQFIMSPHAKKEIPAMMDAQDYARGAAQYIGELVNQFEEQLSTEEAKALEEILGMELLTETTRKITVKSRTASTKKNLQDLKLMYHRLIQTEKMLAQAIKTRREEPRGGI
jgi:hypothetical protein